MFDWVQNFADWLWKFIDQGVIDGTVNGTAQLVDVSGEVRRVTQTGQIRYYALMIFAGSVVMIVFYLVP